MARDCTHEDIEATKGLDSSVDQRLDLVLLADIALDTDSLAGRESLFDESGGLADGLLVDVTQDELGAL